MAKVTDPKSRLFGLLWGGGTGVFLLSALMISAARSYSMTPSTAVDFGAHILIGPIDSLIRGPMSAGQLGFTIFVILLLAAHVIRPSIASFICTICGIVLWLLTGLIWVSRLA